MILKKTKIFSQFPNVIFGFSTKSNHQADDKFYFNMSKSIGDDEKNVLENRNILFSSIGLNKSDVIIQKQTHSDIVNVVNEFANDLVGDALITNKQNLGLAISTADCTNIYLYDSKQQIIAAVHSGWKGTELQILSKTLQKLIEEFNSMPNDIFVYFGPSICQEKYKVGKDFTKKFEPKYLSKIDDKYFLDLKRANEDMLLEFGVPQNHIEVSDNCSFTKNNFHSFRRDKKNSGRALGVIALRKLYES